MQVPTEENSQENSGKALARRPNLLRVREQALLAAASEAATLNQLVTETSIPKTTVWRLVKRMATRGMLRRVGDTFVATEASVTCRGIPEFATDRSGRLSATWPFMNWIPNPVFRALLSLILFARIARESRISEDLHYSFLLFGPTQRLKSWLSRSVCSLLGADLEYAHFVLPEARDLLQRNVGKDKCTGLKRALMQPVIWFEGVVFGDPKTRFDLTSFVRGSLEYCLGTEKLEMDALVILEGLPKAGETSLQQRLGFDSAQLRRMILADFGNVVVSQADMECAEELLNKIKQFGPAHIPSTSDDPLPHACQSLLSQALGLCVRPDTQSLVDLGRLVTLAKSAKGILRDPFDATLEVLRAYFTVVETAGLLFEDWRIRLAALEPEFLTEAALWTSRQTAGVANVPPCQSIADSRAGLVELIRTMSENGLSLGEDAILLGDAIKLIGHLRQSGTQNSAIESTLRNTERWADLAREMACRGLNPEQVAQGVQLCQKLFGLAVMPNDLAEYLEVHSLLREKGLNLRGAQELAALLADRMQQGQPMANAVDGLLRAVRTGLDLGGQASNLLDAIDTLDVRRSEIVTEQTALMENVRALKAEHDSLFRDNHELENALQTLGQQVLDLLKQKQATEHQLATIDQFQKDLVERLTRESTLLKAILLSFHPPAGQEEFSKILLPEIAGLFGLMSGLVASTDLEKDKKAKQLLIETLMAAYPAAAIDCPKTIAFTTGETQPAVHP